MAKRWTGRGKGQKGGRGVLRKVMCHDIPLLMTLEQATSRQQQQQAHTSLGRDAYSVCGGGGGSPTRAPHRPDDEMTTTKFRGPVLANFHHF